MNREIAGLYARLMSMSDEFEDAARDCSAYSGDTRSVLFLTAQDLNHLAVTVRESVGDE